MAFDSLSAFLAMGNHGFYVWLSYGSTFVVLLLMVLAPMRTRRHLLRNLRGQQRRTAGQDTLQAGSQPPMEHN